MIKRHREHFNKYCAFEALKHAFKSTNVSFNFIIIIIIIVILIINTTINSIIFIIVIIIIISITITAITGLSCWEKGERSFSI